MSELRECMLSNCGIYEDAFFHGWTQEVGMSDYNEYVYSRAIVEIKKTGKVKTVLPENIVFKVEGAEGNLSNAVRCKDCKYWQEWTCIGATDESRIGHKVNECSIHGNRTNADMFCADGERRSE